MFKAVSMLLGDTFLRYRFFEGSRIKNEIFKLGARERAGESIDAESLGEPVREWLSDRGFRTREDLNELVEIGGDLGRSLHILLVVLGKILARVSTENRFKISIGHKSIGKDVIPCQKNHLLPWTSSYSNK